MNAHQVIWSVIDEMARRNKMSLCHLALISGLDNTCLAPNKRFTRNGKPRWPSIETVYKILTATHTDVITFVRLIQRIQSQE